MVVSVWEERKGQERKSNNSKLRPLSSKLCMLLGWFLTNVLSKTVLVLQEKDEAVRCDLATV